MQIIEIIALENGAHRNQKASYLTAANLPEGWAIVPDDMPIPDTFPFVDITVEGNTVTSMTAGVVPEPEPEPEPGPTAEERIAELEDAMCDMDAANQAEITDLQDTVSALEDAICEMDAANEERMAAIEDELCEMDMG